MTRSTCRYFGCDADPRGGGGFAGKFCSWRCELRFEHIRDDAQDAQRSATHE